MRLIAGAVAALGLSCARGSQGDVNLDADAIIEQGDIAGTAGDARQGTGGAMSQASAGSGAGNGPRADSASAADARPDATTAALDAAPQAPTDAGLPAPDATAASDAATPADASPMPDGAPPDAARPDADAPDAGSPVIETSAPDNSCERSDFGGHAYWFCSDNDDWEGARPRCQQVGGDLASINDQAEQDFIEDNISGLGDWLVGLTQSSGSWQWVDGSDANGSYTNWGSGEPDSNDCGAIDNDGDWKDKDCDDNENWICEVPPTGP